MFVDYYTVFKCASNYNTFFSDCWSGTIGSWSADEIEQLWNRNIRTGQISVKLAAHIASSGRFHYIYNCFLRMLWSNKGEHMYAYDRKYKTAWARSCFYSFGHKSLWQTFRYIQNLLENVFDIWPLSFIVDMLICRLC